MKTKEEEIIELINYLSIEVDAIEKEDGVMDKCSWPYQTGIIISGNDAKLILEAMDEYASLREVKYKKLIEVWKEYAKLLGESEGNLAIFADTHGIKVDPKIVKRGKEFRQKISEIEQELGLTE